MYLKTKKVAMIRSYTSVVWVCSARLYTLQLSQFLSNFGHRSFSVHTEPYVDKKLWKALIASKKDFLHVEGVLQFYYTHVREIIFEVFQLEY